MPLKMIVEPQEWLMIGGTRVVNIHPEQATFFVDGSGPVLRQAHTLSEEMADTAAKRAYLAVQRLYLGMATDMSEYQVAASALLQKVPSSKEVVLKANVQMAKGSVYGALREYRKLLVG
jgi:hypothetical protein